MIIIIEGADGSGKSTLACALEEATHYKVVHRTKPETDEEKKQMMHEYAALITNHEDVIFDRCWYSELVYGKVMRDNSCISTEDMFALEQLICENGGGIIIYCTDEPQVLWKRCCDRGEDYIKNYMDFKEICDEYNSIMRMMHKIPVIRYGFEEMS